MREADLLARLDQRLGALHARQRLGIEADHEAQCFGQGLNFFHIENWYSVHSVIRNALRISGLYGRGQRNAGCVQVRRNTIRATTLPRAFDGFTILHLSDLHADMSIAAMDRLIELLPSLRYDICVLTGDYRGKTFGPFDAAIDGVARVFGHLAGPVYGVLVIMTPSAWCRSSRIWASECCSTRPRPLSATARAFTSPESTMPTSSGSTIWRRPPAAVPPGDFSLLLSHTPEIYRQAAHSGFDALLAGHTHGGQICLPGGVPITLDSDLPRRFGAGAWRYGGMAGYTSAGVGCSIVTVRLNCPPEITLHRLECASAQ